MRSISPAPRSPSNRPRPSTTTGSRRRRRRAPAPPTGRRRRRRRPRLHHAALATLEAASDDDRRRRRRWASAALREGDTGDAVRRVPGHRRRWGGRDRAVRRSRACSARCTSVRTCATPPNSPGSTPTTPTAPAATCSACWTPRRSRRCSSTEWWPAPAGAASARACVRRTRTTARSSSISRARSGAGRAAAGDYPSHLHIDMLPDVQGGGRGGAMLRTLLDALAAAGSPGVHLGVVAGQRARHRLLRAPRIRRRPVRSRRRRTRDAPRL